MVFTGTTRRRKKKKKRVIFRAVSLLAGLLPRALFGDNNKDGISNNLATLKRTLPELDGAGLLFLGLQGQGVPQSCQVTKQPKLCKISEFNVDRDRGRREKLISKEVARVEKRHLTD